MALIVNRTPDPDDDDDLPGPFFHKNADDTERAAAERAAKTLTEASIKVLRHLVATGGTNDDAGSIATGLLPNTYPARRYGLYMAGYVRKSGRRAPTSAGSTAIVWEVTDAGVAWLESQ